MQQPPKVIPVAMDAPTAPAYDPASQTQQMYNPAQPEQESKLTEWWNWITLRRHAPGTYYENQQQHYQPQQEEYSQQPPQTFSYPRPPPYNPQYPNYQQQYQGYQPQQQYPVYPQQYSTGYGTNYGPVPPYG